MSSSGALQRFGRRFAIVAAVAALLLVGAGSAAAKKPPPAPDFGPNVYVFDPSMPTSQIQSTVDAIAAQQIPNQFGTQRYALLFKPGTYGTAQTPLNFQVGYYTSVAGLGASPNDVHVNGSVYVRNQCDANGCVALNNFWRSLENLTIDVNTPNFGCYNGEFWAVSQAAPMRRVHVNGPATLMDYCTGPSFASGGFIADSRFDNGSIVNGSQQQWLVRNSTIDGWSNGMWNQVFSGVVNAPAQCFPAVPNGCGPYTTLPTSTVTRDAPYLYVDSNGNYDVFVPAVQRNSSGADWESGTTAGTSIPIDDFFIAKPSDDAQKINSELARGKNLILTPGVYHVDKTIDVKRAGTVVLGLGFPTLVPDHGVATMKVADVPGVKLTGLLFDAGAQRSPVLLEVGPKHAHKSDAADPTSVQDVFFRIGGATPGKAKTSLVVNSDNVILDDIWAWRADHGDGVGWTANTADTGVIVNGDDVTAYGLFVEHYQRYRGDLERRARQGRLLPERDAVRPAEPGLLDGGARRSRLRGVQGGRPGEELQRLRDGQLQLLQPGRRHLRRARVRGPDDAAGGKPQRPADDLPRREQREGRDPQRRQRHGRPVDGRQPGHAGDGGQLPVS